MGARKKPGGNGDNGTPAGGGSPPGGPGDPGGPLEPGDGDPATRRDLRLGMAGLRAEVHVGFVGVTDRLDGVNERLDNLIQILGDRYRGAAPHVGQVVLYRLRNGRWFPAVVLDVHGGDRLDLEVFGAKDVERFPAGAVAGEEPGQWRNPP